MTRTRRWASRWFSGGPPGDSRLTGELPLDCDDVSYQPDAHRHSLGVLLVKTPIFGTAPPMVAKIPGALETQEVASHRLIIQRGLRIPVKIGHGHLVYSLLQVEGRE